MLVSDFVCPQMSQNAPLAAAVLLVLLIFPLQAASASSDSSITSLEDEVHLNVGAIAVGDSVQMGYQSTYTATGTIQGVSTEIPLLPDRNPAGGGWVAFLLNTGDTGSCSGFMQVGLIQYVQGGAFGPVYMNGDSYCSPTSFTQYLGAAPGHDVIMEISHSGSNTTYYIYDSNSGYSASASVSSLSTWSSNSFQTMTEGTFDGGTEGGMRYANSYFIDPNGNWQAITTGSQSWSNPSQYGGACSTSSYFLPSWDNNRYGYSESSFATEGYCAHSMTSYDHAYGNGGVNNANGIIGGPDSSSTEIYAPNSGGWAQIVSDFGQTFSGTLYLDMYSYNNGGGAYYSWVNVSVSADASTWTTLWSGSYVNPSGTNAPSWISIGSVSSVKYVWVEVQYHGGYSADLFIDAEAIG